MPTLPRIVFMGTPDLASASLRALLAADGLQVVGVVTQPDRPKGRSLKPQPSPVKELALAADVPILQPERAREPGFLEALRDLAPDLIAVAAFGQILPPSLLELPPHGCLNVHTSLLPKYRGASPIQAAILHGEAETGVTIMRMDAGLDTGGIVAQERTLILRQDTAQTLHDRLAEMGARLLVRIIPGYVRGEWTAIPQPLEGASYAPKIKKEDGRLDWRLPAPTLWNRVRGLIPWPGAFTHFSANPPKLLKIWAAEPRHSSGLPGAILTSGPTGIVVGCGVGSLNLTELQLEGGRRLEPGPFLAGHPLPPGTRLASS